MNTTETELLVARCLKSGSGLWVDTDYGQLDLYGADLEETWNSLSPGEAFVVLGVLNEREDA